MKISIVTLNGYKNYGNRLQLFALSRTLAAMNNKVSVFWPRTLKENLKIFVKCYTPFVPHSIKEKKLNFFTKKYITRSVTTRHSGVAVIGSDQVWNPRYIEERPYLLMNDCRDAISHAASMGIATLEPQQKEMFRDLLKKVNAISVREKSAKELLQPLTDKKIEVVLDPTLLLDKSEYEQLERKPKNLKNNEKYILCYILGNREQQTIIEKYANEHDLKVILFSDKRDSDYGVEEFLYLIHHAQLICTDSFHACVFSFIFERPFVAFRRTGVSNYMYTRLQNLIETFNLKNREFNGKEITKENLEVNYTEAKKILKKEQKKSLDFLKRALDIEDEK